MSNINFKVLRNLSFGFLTTLFLILIALAIITYSYMGISNSPIYSFAVKNHLTIMLVLAFVSVAFGFYWATLSTTEIQRKDKQTRNILDVVMLFLSHDEKKIIDFLVKNKGTTTQAEISRIDAMGRVRAYRSLKKLSDKNIIQISPHGKIRKISLQEPILNLLLNEPA